MIKTARVIKGIVLVVGAFLAFALTFPWMALAFEAYLDWVWRISANWLR